MSVARLRYRCVLAALFLCLGAADALGATWLYGSSQSGLYRINPTTAATTAVYTGAPFPTAGFVAALAERLTDGMLFFIVGSAGNDQVYRWDPATPLVAPVLLGTTGAGIPYFPRIAFDPVTGVLYAVNTATTGIYTINTTTGAATLVGALTGGPTGNSGGDMAFSGAGTLYLVARNGAVDTIYTVHPATGAGAAGEVIPPIDPLVLRLPAWQDGAPSPSALLGGPSALPLCRRG